MRLENNRMHGAASVRSAKRCGAMAVEAWQLMGEGWGGMHEVLDMWIGVDTDTAECYAGIESAAYGDNVEPL
jgi:hypothetical protein